MREIFAGILLMFAFASLGFADTSVQSPDWDVLTVGETESATVNAVTPVPDRSYNVTGGDHATIAKTTTINCKRNCSVGWVPHPFEVGWRSSNLKTEIKPGV